MAAARRTPEAQRHDASSGSPAPARCATLISMSASEVRAFASRLWEEARKAKEAYWVEEVREHPALALAAAWALWEHMRAIRPDWPDPAQRADDFAHHLALRSKLDRTARVIAPR